MKYEKVDIDRYQKMLDRANGLSQARQKFVQSVIDSVKKRNGITTFKQFDILKRLETGDWTYHSKN